MRRYAILFGVIVSTLFLVFTQSILATELNLRKGWAVGEGGLILNTIDGGKTWVTQESGVKIDLRSVWFIDQNKGFVVGDDACILRTIDGGKIWKAGKYPVKAKHSCVLFIDPKKGLIATDLSHILRTNDGGTIWEPSAVVGENVLMDMSFADSQGGLIVGWDPEKDAPCAMSTKDGGETWQETVINKATGIHLISVSHGTNASAWAVGQRLLDSLKPNGTIFYTKDGGANWEIQWTHKVTYLYTTCFVNAKVGWAAGYAGSLAKPIVLTTEDSGKNWKPHEVPGKEIITNSFLADHSNGWVVGTNGLIAYTKDFGKTWHLQQSGVQKTIYALHFPQYVANKQISHSGQSQFQSHPPNIQIDVQKETTRLHSDDPVEKDDADDLIAAASSGDIGQLLSLLEKGTDVNAKNTDGVTALYVAAQKGHAEVVKLLLESKADVNAKDTDSVTALMIGAARGHADIVKLLLESKANVNAKDTDSVTALWMAAQEGHPEIANILLESKADVNVQRKTDDVTALMIGVAKGHTDIVKLLLEARADVNIARKTDGITPLFMASMKGYTEIVKLLLAAKANVNTANKTDDVTSLFIASQNGHSEIVKLLLVAGADVNVKVSKADKDYTPLSLAEMKGHTQIIKLLKEYSTKNKEQKSLSSSSHPKFQSQGVEHLPLVVQLAKVSEASVETEQYIGAIVTISATEACEAKVAKEATFATASDGKKHAITYIHMLSSERTSGAVSGFSAARGIEFKLGDKTYKCFSPFGTQAIQLFDDESALSVSFDKNSKIELALLFKGDSRLVKSITILGRELSSKQGEKGAPPSRIAFRSNRDGNWEIYVINQDGSQLKRLTSNTFPDDQPRFSPDGNKIVFRSERSGNQDIYIMNADGSEQNRLTTDPAKDSEPAFSPDGSRVVFASKRDGDWRIYLMNADGSQQRRLSDINGSGPRYSPDGKQIAFSSMKDGNPEIYIMNADGNNHTRLTKNTTVDSGPSFSADGKSIVFTAMIGRNLEVCQIPASGGEVKNLSRNPANDGAPCYTPDGKFIIFMSSPNGELALYIMKADGSEPKRLSPPQASDAMPHVAGMA